MKTAWLAVALILPGIAEALFIPDHPDPARRWIPGADMAIEGLVEDDELKYDVGRLRLLTKSNIERPVRTPSGIVHREKACLGAIMAVHPSRRRDPPAQRRLQYHEAAEHLIGGANGLIVMAVMGTDERVVLGMYSRVSDGFLQQDDDRVRTEVESLRRYPRTPENISLAAGIIELGVAHVSGRSLSGQDVDFLSRLCSYAKDEDRRRVDVPTAVALADLNAQKPFSRKLERAYLQLLTQAQNRPTPDRVEISAIRLELAFRLLINPKADSWSERKQRSHTRKVLPYFEANAVALRDERSPRGVRLMLTSMGMAFMLKHGLDSQTDAQRLRARQEAERLLEIGMQRRTVSVQGYYALLSGINAIVKDDPEAMRHPALAEYYEDCEKPRTISGGTMADAFSEMIRCSPEAARYLGSMVSWAYAEHETLASAPTDVFDDVSQAVRTGMNPLDDGANGAVSAHLDDEKELKALMLRGQHAQAEKLAIGLIRSGNADALSLARANAALGEIDIHGGRYITGMARVRKAMELNGSALPDNHPDRTAYRALLARGHAALNEPAEALALYRSLTRPWPRNSIEQISFKLQQAEPISTEERSLLDQIRKPELSLISLDAYALRNRIRHAGLPSTLRPEDDKIPDYDVLISRTRRMLGPDSPREAVFHVQAALEAKATGSIAQAVKSATTALAILQRNPPPETSVSPTDPAWWHQPTRYVAEQAFLIVTDASARAGTAGIDQAFVALQLLHRNDDASALHNVRARLAADTTTSADIREYEQLLGRLPNHAADDADAAQQDAEVQQRLDLLRSQIQARHPAYFALLADSIVDASQLRDRLPGDTLYYQIARVGDAYYGIALTKQGGRTIRLAPVQTVDADVDALLESVRGWESARSTPFAQAAAERLHTRLIAPVADELASHERVVLVAATQLAALPLAAIKAPGRAQGYLGMSHAIVSAPSASSWLGLASRAPETRRLVPLLGMGNPRVGVLSVSTSDFASSKFVFRGSDAPAPPDPQASILSLPALPETADEIEAIARLLDHGDNTILLGAAATEAAARNAVSRAYATLAFSTHGIALANDAGVEEPGLVMTPPPDVTRAEDDGFLAASEIAGLELSAELVLLAACSTDRTRAGALGSLGPLVRAFHFAGADQVLATRWKIDSLATQSLVTRFVQALRDSPERGAAHALRTATNALAADPQYGDPRFWAAFHVSGGI